jgi:hypothetical protein
VTNKEINLEEITKRLDIIIYLLIKQTQEKDEATKKEIIADLFEWGLKDFEIAKILGKSRSYVSSEITKFKKSKKKEVTK